MLEIDRAIRATLLHLEKILREAGDNNSADRARIILQSPDHISNLHQTFASNLKRTLRTDNASQERRLWFENFSSRNGNCLEEQQLQKLTDITRHWALSEEKVDALASCSLLWSSCPRLFWDGKNENTNMIQRCLDDLERIREIEPLRRKIILIVLSEYVGSEQEQVRISGKRQRARYHSNTETQGAYRRKMLLPTSLRAIVGRIWPGAHPAEKKKLKRMLSLNSRYGWKWQQVRPREMILSLPDCAAGKFEKAAWTEVEFEAINQFIKTLPQYRIQALLRGTMSSLLSYYKGKIKPDVLPTTSVGTISTPAIVDQQIPTLGQPCSVLPTTIPQPNTTQDHGNSRLVSSVIPISAGVRPVSHSEEAVSFQEPATPELSDNFERPASRVCSVSPTTISRRSDLTENPLCHETCQTSSDSHFENSPLPGIPKASPAYDARPGSYLNCFNTSQSSPDGYLSSGQSDMMILQSSAPSNQAHQNMNETALCGREFNDTSLAMQGLFSGFSNTPLPEINDPSSLMQLFTSETEHHRRTANSAVANNVGGAANGFRPLDSVLPNDTSLALFAIEPQTEINLIHPSFNDTSLTMSAFASGALYYDEGGFGTNSSQ